MGRNPPYGKETRNIFSSDLIFGMGEARGKIRNGNWKEEISNITPDQIPNPEKDYSFNKAYLN